MQQAEKGKSSILYGVPRAYYGAYDGCTPYPICLKSCANYLGQEVSYDDLIVGCGAAFRLVWNTQGWDGGNVDVMFAFDDPDRVYRLGVQALGRSFSMVQRERGAAVVPGQKQDFIDFFKPRLAAGLPVIALGIIGPPEACVLTGYEEDGAVLLGWNLFQDIPDFGGAVEKMEGEGYFRSRTWWENPDTLALIGLGEKVGEPLSLQSIIQNAVQVLSGRVVGEQAKGLAAYDAWKKAVLDEGQFPSGMILPLLSERLMCQADAMDCLSDGRYNAARFFEKQALLHPAHAAAMGRLAARFTEVSKAAFAMGDLLGGWDRGEAQMRNFARRDVREGIAAQIDAAKAADEQALEALGQLEKAL